MRAAAGATLWLVATVAGDTWVYSSTPGDRASAKDQERTWPEACARGRMQSPIDIVTAGVRQGPAGTIRPDFTPMPLLLKNTGHSFQIHEMEATFKGHTEIRGIDHTFYQVHWHTPSENVVDGVQFDMEAHFVHQLPPLARCRRSLCPPSNDGLAVVGVLYRLNDTCNEVLDRFWEEFPLQAGSVQTVERSAAGRWPEAVNLTNILTPLLPGGHYQWSGSLTTPPCTEGVDWTLMRTPTHVCARQVARLREALGSTQHGVIVNNRVIHPLNGRTVTLYAPPHAHPPQPQASMLAAAAFLAAAACLLSAVCMHRTRTRSSHSRPPKWTAGGRAASTAARSGTRSDGDAEAADGVALGAYLGDGPGHSPAVDGTDGGYDVRPIPSCASAQAAVSATTSSPPAPTPPVL